MQHIALQCVRAAPVSSNKKEHTDQQRPCIFLVHCTRVLVPQCRTNDKPFVCPVSFSANRLLLRKKPTPKKLKIISRLRRLLQQIEIYKELRKHKSLSVQCICPIRRLCTFRWLIEVLKEKKSCNCLAIHTVGRTCLLQRIKFQQSQFITINIIISSTVKQLLIVCQVSPTTVWHLVNESTAYI